MVCVDCIEKKDITLAKIVPPAKQLTEKLLYLVKGMLVYNNSSDAFWMGNLLNRNLEGQQICSQVSISLRFLLPTTYQPIHYVELFVRSIFCAMIVMTWRSKNKLCTFLYMFKVNQFCDESFYLVPYLFSYSVVFRGTKHNKCQRLRRSRFRGRGTFGNSR